MSTSALTLQCPNCGGVFLTLHLGTGGMEICPHCAISAPRANYLRLEGQSAFVRARTPLPPRRGEPDSFSPTHPPIASDPVPAPPSPAPWEPAAAPVAIHQASPPPPLPTHAAEPPAVWAPETAAAPPPPLSPPLHAFSTPTAHAAPQAPQFEPPQPATSLPPAAAFFHPPPSQPAPSPPFSGGDPLPPPQIGFTPPSETSAAPPAFPMAPSVPPMQHAPSSTIGFESTAPLPGPPPLVEKAPAPAEETARSAWPVSVGPAVPASINPVAAPPLAAEERESAAAPGWMESQEIPVEDKPKPLPESRKVPWLTYFCVLSVIVGLGFSIWKSAQPRRFSVVKKTADVASLPETETVRRAAPAASVPAEDTKPTAPPSPALASTAPSQTATSPPSKPAAQVAASAPPGPAVPPPVSPDPAPPPQPAPVATAPPSPAPAPSSSTVATAAAPSATSAPEPVTAGPLPDAETLARIRAARELLEAVDSATSTDERLKWIVDGADHRERVEKFFRDHPSGLHVTGMESNVGSYIELPTGDEVKLLLANTASCPSGAVVRLRTQGGRALLDWPLFEQTHQLEFDSFASDAQAPPRQFSVICARSSANDLPDAEKEKYVALRAQGSLGAHGEAIVYLPKDSTAGGFLDSKIVWGRGYLVEASLQHTTVAGKQVLIVADCVGAASAAK